MRHSRTRRGWKTRARHEPGRFLAALWMLLAVLSMPVVAAASSGNERDLARISGDSTGAAGRPADPAALSRPILRAAPPADLKFSAERGDPKAVPGGPDPAILPCPSHLARAGVIACRQAIAEDSLRRTAEACAYRPRAPPLPV